MLYNLDILVLLFFSHFRYLLLLQNLVEISLEMFFLYEIYVLYGCNYGVVTFSFATGSTIEGCGRVVEGYG